MAHSFYRCGCCESVHPSGFLGDCREDNERFTADELDEKYGFGEWIEHGSYDDPHVESGEVEYGEPPA